ncbi:Na/Pi symporter [Bacillus tianshenii]|nr:Na/Pi symporter [Bacillus tianshenii]
MHMLSFLMVFIMIFLMGMSIMRYGLFHLAHDTLQQKLVHITDTPLKGMLAGTLITAVLQSSSAVTVMTVALCAAGYLTFEKALGIILGTNIGTTVTLEMISIDLGQLALPLLIFSALLMMISRKKLFDVGSILFGFSCLFIAMNGFSSLASFFSESPLFTNLLTADTKGHVNGILFGTVLTAILQSSTAVTGMGMGIIEKSSIPLSTGIAVMLGANIGTCITAFLASLRANNHAKLTAYAHIWLNIIGVLAFYPLIQLLTNTAMILADSPDVQLAHASVIFNVLVSLIFLPLIKPFASFIKRVHRQE